MAKRHLIIDADIVAFQACASVEEPCEWEPGYWSWHTNFNDTAREVLRKLEEIRVALDVAEGEMTLCLSDAKNFRHSILPTYKGWRKAVKKPIVLLPIKEWMEEELGALRRPGLEGDDLCGILATYPKWHGRKEKIIVSLDKDLKTIPGKYVRSLRPEDCHGPGDPIIQEITEDDADEWHMIQTLAGDAVDGYSGCPDVGIARATEAIVGMRKLEPYEHELTRGKRKGEIETRWNPVPATDRWEIVTSYYARAGLSEEVALTQARVARILRAQDYDFKKGEPILWRPPRRRVS